MPVLTHNFKLIPSKALSIRQKIQINISTIYRGIENAQEAVEIKNDQSLFRQLCQLDEM